MTFEERLAELGVDPDIISLHEDRCDALYERFYKASEATAQELGIGFSALTMITLLLREIAERDDIIDRMETRIVNLTGDLKFAVKHIKEDCPICANRNPDNPLECAKYVVVDVPDDCYEFGGVPEDYNPDVEELP